jgi:hypothetical protein
LWLDEIGSQPARQLHGNCAKKPGARTAAVQTRVEPGRLSSDDLRNLILNFESDLAELATLSA